MAVERIALNLKPWQIITLGILSVLASGAAVGLLASIGYALFPDAYGVVAVVHILGAGAAGFYVGRLFVEAWLFRRLLGKWNKHRVTYVPPLDVFDEEK